MHNVFSSTINFVHWCMSCSQTNQKNPKEHQFFYRHSQLPTISREWITFAGNSPSAPNSSLNHWFLSIPCSSQSSRSDAANPRNCPTQRRKAQFSPLGLERMEGCFMVRKHCLANRAQFHKISLSALKFIKLGLRMWPKQVPLCPPALSWCTEGF